MQEVKSFCWEIGQDRSFPVALQELDSLVEEFFAAVLVPADIISVEDKIHKTDNEEWLTRVVIYQKK